MGSVGNRIKDCRTAKGLTQEDVAKELGIGKQAVYKYETGAVTNIPLVNIEIMAKMFEVSPCYLAGWNKEPSEGLFVITEEIKKRLVDAYRKADDKIQKAALRMLEDSAAENTPKKDSSADQMA